MMDFGAKGCYSTISSGHETIVAISVCSSMFVCTGNLELSFIYHELGISAWESHWSSSFGSVTYSRTNPIYIGRAGWTAQNMTSPSGLPYLFLRPALSFKNQTS